ncbi:hypothetical protein WJX84_005826 [Apatococcus fuscideae]|uniref:Secreted protein n=1 Tax=Apatococcus fuscideae TaxID=2026836 RepID=A0AAW1TBR7_9CHLO
MVVRWTLSLGLHSSFVFLICSSCRVFAASPSPSSDNGGGGINVSGIPGIGITKHKWWVWLLVSLGGEMQWRLFGSASLAPLIKIIGPCVQLLVSNETPTIQATSPTARLSETPGLRVHHLPCQKVVEIMEII